MTATTKVPLVVWTGPVALAQVPGATLPNAITKNTGCYGDRPPRCLDVSARWKNLQAMCADLQVDPSQISDVYMGAFSAGGGVQKRFVENDANRKVVRALMVADAIYSDVATNEGFVKFILEAARGSKFFVSTHSRGEASGPGTDGVTRMLQVKAEVEKRLGKPIPEVPVSTWEGVVSPLPEKLWHLGNAWLADYQFKISHQSHAGLQSGLWTRLLIPWVAGGGASTSGVSSSSLLPGLFSGIFGFLAGKYAIKKWT